MKRKTYHNFLIIRNKLMSEKGYTPQEASDLTHKIFENTHNDALGRTAEHFYSMVLPKAEFEAQHN